MTNDPGVIVFGDAPPSLEPHARRVLALMGGDPDPDDGASPLPTFEPILMSIIASILATLLVKGIMALLRRWWPDLFGARRRRLMAVVDAVFAAQPATVRGMDVAAHGRREEVADAVTRYARSASRDEIRGLVVACRAMGVRATGFTSDGGLI